MAVAKPRTSRFAAAIRDTDHRFSETGIAFTRATISTSSAYGGSTAHAIYVRGNAARSATTAGIVWLAAPKGERRKTGRGGGAGPVIAAALSPATRSWSDLSDRLRSPRGR